MALEELQLTDKIEVIANGSLQIRHRHSIVDADTGVEKAASFHRHVVSPGDDVTGECDRVKAIAAAVWTPECIAAYQAAIATEPESVVTETPTEA